MHLKKNIGLEINLDQVLENNKKQEERECQIQIMRK